MQSRQPPFQRRSVSSHGAALLLMKVREIARHEVHKKHPLLVEEPGSLILSSLSSDSSDWDVNLHLETPTQPRCRAVSVCSIDIVEQRPPHPISPSHEEEGDSLLTLSPGSTTSCSIKIPEGSTETSKLVGSEVVGPVKGILRKKFSWKNYPELEAYLVENRLEYLQYSSQLNYTAEQKRYNNKLTQGLLDLGKEEGYLFEGFTFAAVRDRIRCYYKSFVQATKKKKRKKRK